MLTTSLKAALTAAATIAAASLFTATAQAQVSDELDDFWSGVQANANVTGPRADIGQEGGYFTGGSLVYRAPQDNLQIMSAQAPSVRAGCGGIDIFSGGFSFVNAEQLVAHLRALAANAQGVAFSLALKTLCPQCEDAIQDAQDMAQEINAMNINSCESAQNLMEGLWPRNTRARDHICQSSGSRSGRFSDWVQARHQCGTGGQDPDTDADTQNRVPTNINIAWRALTEQGFMADQQTAEFAMSLTGTMIITKGANADTGDEYRFLPPLGASQEVIDALLTGGTMTIYRCDETSDCLGASEQDTQVGETSGIYGRVVDTINGILDSIETEQTLTAEQRSFLNATSLPVYRILSVNHAYKGMLARADTPQLAEYIAIELVTLFMSDMMQQVLQTQTTVEHHTMSVNYEEWRAGIVSTLQNLAERQRAVAERHGYTHQVVERYQSIERALQARTEHRIRRVRDGQRRS
tara:strand:- start:172 stop:1569 length:1398 start_codon:yes stop_codon:yes gene_type:complete